MSGQLDLYKPTSMAGLQRIGQSMAGKIAAAAPRFMRGAEERVLRCLFTEVQKTPALLECSPASIFEAVLQVTQLGLEVGGATGQAYLLPFGQSKKGAKACTLVIGYKGYVQLALRSNLVRRITPCVVRQNDAFEMERGLAQRLRHVPAGDDSPAVGYYAVVEMTNGGADFEYMTVAQAQAHRARFALMKSGGPWANNFDEMALKTCIRKLAKRLPLSPEMTAAAALDDQADAGDAQTFDIPLGEPEGPAPDGVNDLEAEIQRIEDAQRENQK